MLIQRFKGKIHRATITEANLNYVGSITIDGLLLDAAGIIEGKRCRLSIITTGSGSKPTPSGGKRAPGSFASTEPRRVGAR